MAVNTMLGSQDAPFRGPPLADRAMMTVVIVSLSVEGLASAGPFAFGAVCGWRSAPPAQALQDPAMAGDRSDQDRIGCDIGAREDDAFAQLGAIADAGAIAEHDRPHQAYVRPDPDVAPDPHRRLDLRGPRQRILEPRALVGDDHPRSQLLALDLQAQLAAQRVEGPLPELAQRADVVPV